MKIREGSVYHLNDNFYNLMQGYDIKNKSPGGRTYPAYCCCHDKSDFILWMIPMSTNIAKYQAVYHREMEKYGRCLSVVLGTYDNKTVAFQIQGMFPIKKEHILHPHTRNGRIVPVEYSLRDEIRSKFNKVREFEDKGIKCTLTDIRRIGQLLLLDPSF